MKIHNKIRILLLILVGVFTLASFFIQRYVVFSKFVDIEHKEAEDDLSRCVASIKREGEALATLLEDWSTWNESYKFIKDRNRDFIQDNLLKETYIATGLNLIYFINLKGEVVWGKVLINGKKVMLPEFPEGQWKPDNRLLVGGKDHRIIYGVINTSIMPMVIGAGRVVKSNFTGASRGTLIMGKFLTPKLLNKLEKQTKVNFNFYSLDSKKLRKQDLINTKGMKVNTYRITKCVRCAGIIHAYYLMADLFGKKSFLVKSFVSPQYIETGLSAMWVSLLSWLVLGAILLWCFHYFIKKNVVCPLVMVTEYASGVGENKDLSARLNMTRTGEIGALTKEINKMMEKLEGDIEERSKVENQLRISRKRYRDMLMGLPVGFYRHTIGHVKKFTFLNPAFLKIFGCETSEEFKYNNDLTDWFESVKYEELLNNPDDSEGRNFILHKRSGETVYVRVWTGVVDSGEEKFAEGVILDTTVQKKAEADIRRLAAVVTQAEEMIVITDISENIIYVNPAFETTTGYSSEEVLGRNPNILQSGKQSKEFYEDLWSNITSGKSWKGVFINKKKTGEFYTEKGYIFPLYDDEGIICNYVGLKRDITNELRLEQQMRQSHKMEAIGTLAGGIAHDFNNILSAILGYANLALKEENSTPVQVIKYIKKISIAGSRAKDLTAQILTFSRQKQDDIAPLQVGLIVNEACKLLRASIPTSIKIERRINSKSLAVVDPTQVHQIMLNLCTNASQSMEGCGVLTVSLDDVYLTDVDVEEFSELPPGRYLRLVIKDTGHGMDEDTQKRVFEPFFTTKDVGSGTGMGLSVVHGIVTGVGGAIKIRSHVNEGSSFIIYLPIVERDTVGVEAKEKHEKDLEKLFGKERILFVDDEQILVDLNKETLEDFGYQFFGYSSSNEALEAFKSNPSGYDIIISDLTMPEMTGDVFAAKALEIRPDIPVVVCTGYSNLANEKQLSELGVCILVHKPIIGRQLAETIRSILDN